VNHRRVSCAIPLLAAVLASCLLYGPLEHCDAQTSEALSQPAATTAPASGPGIGAAPKPKPTTKPKRDWFLKSNPNGNLKTTIGSLDARTGYTFQVEFVNEFAAIRTLKLSEYFTTVADKQEFHRDPDAYMERINTPGADDGHYTLLNHVSYAKKRHLPLATTIYVKVDGEKSATRLPITNHWRMGETQTSQDGNTQSLSFTCTAYRASGEDDSIKAPTLKLTKTYTIRKENYTVQVSLKAENLSAEQLSVRIDQAGPTGVPRESHRGDERFAVWGMLGEGGEVEPVVELKKELTEERYNSRHVIGTTAGTTGESGKPAILWIGQGNKFFASMFYLNPEVDKRLEAANYDATIYTNGAYETLESRTHLTGVDIPALKLAPNASKTVKFDLFAGPKIRAMFTDEDDEFFRQQYKDLNYKGAINLGGCWCTSDLITFGMMWLLNLFASVAFGNYGIAIFILVILVRLALHPLTKKGQVSMVKMQKMQPVMAKLKEKYADDKETLQKETMKMYKQQGATPILGCLPMLLQMPIWIALWTGLNAAVELRHTGLLPFWITDLAAPDALISFGGPLPLIGLTSFNLLPILLTIAMFFQAKMNPATSAPSTPEQASMQKMMKYMMPGMMLMIFYNAPSGLSLYIMTSISGGVIEQILIRKHIAEKEAAEAAATTTVRVGGKGFRDNREKKPKSPFKKPW
jgi:YidC/Oxa1 family membrane protein insertase